MTTKKKQEALDRYEHIFWGWDSGAVYYTPERLRDKNLGAAASRCLQEYPDLMAKILALCEDYFKNRD